MSDNQDKPQTQTISAEGFHAFANPLDNNGEPIKHRKKQLPVKYYVRDIENDLGDGGPDLVQIEAIAMQYNVIVSAYLPVEDSDLLRFVADAMIRARLSKKGLQTNNIELVDVDAGENKEVKPSTGQTWTHKQKGYDVKITYINRRGGGIRVEEVATGQPDGFCIKVFLERFSPKNKDSDA